MSFLQDFGSIIVGEEYSSSEKLHLLDYFATSFRKRTLSLDHAEVLLRMLIYPMLDCAFQKQQFDCLNQKVVDSMMKEVLEVPDSLGSVYSKHSSVRAFHG